MVVIKIVTKNKIIMGIKGVNNYKALGRVLGSW